MSLGCVSGMALAAWACIITATAVCDFVKVEGTNDVTGGTESLTRGIWKGQSFVDDSCSKYDGSVFKNTKWHTAEAFSILAGVVGFCAICPLIVACGKKLFISQVAGMAGGCLKASLCSGLTLLFKSSSACQVVGLENTKCSLKLGGNCAIAATVLFAVSGCMMSCAVVAATKMEEEGQGGVDVEEGEK